MPEDSTVEQFLGFILHGALVVMLLLFALNFSLKAAERGLYPHDQSIILDGGYRIVSGQSPYRDFILPFGPMAFWIQAVFSKIFGLNHFSSAISAAAVSVFATLFTVLIVRQLFPDRRSVSYLAGFLTAIWFTPPFGTLWMDQVAFLFVLSAVLLTLYGLPGKEEGRTSDLLFVLSGCAAFLALISKQNIGLFMLPIYPILLIARLTDDKRRLFFALVWFLAGFAGALVAFLVWLNIGSDPSAFWNYAVRMAGRLGIARLFGNVWSSIVTALIGRGPGFNRAVTSAVLLLSISALVFYLRDRRRTGFSAPRLLLPPLVCIHITVSQRLAIATSANQPENGFPLIGIVLAAGTGILLYLFNSENPRIKQFIDQLKPLTRRDSKILLVAAVLLSSLYVTISGITVALNRDVQDSVAGSSFSRYMTDTRLLSLKWGSPTMVQDADVSERDVENILTYLRQSRKNFFVFPDFTLFYMLVGVPSPQPLLYFAPGETYARGGDGQLDSLVVEQLKEHNIEIVVFEEKSISGAEYILADFPKLKSYFEETFVKIGKIGIFHIYRKPEYGMTPQLWEGSLSS